jgi:hypothetical protein
MFTAWVVVRRAGTTEANMVQAKARADVRAVVSWARADKQALGLRCRSLLPVLKQQPIRRHFVNFGFVQPC